MNDDEEGTRCIKRISPQSMDRFVKALANTHIQKIHDMLDARFEKIRNDLGGPNWSSSRSLEEAWANYLNGIDCEVLDEDEAREEFENLFNYSAQTRICVSFLHSYVLVPKELAEKALVLGWMPDEWSPETQNP